MAAPTSGWTSRSRPSAASGDVRPVAGGAIVVAGVDRHPKVWPSHIEDRRVAPGAASARRTGRTSPDAALGLGRFQELLRVAAGALVRVVGAELPDELGDDVARRELGDRRAR